jgi:hypothetical protein
MNKEFLPYELTLELVQLGFNEPCIATIDQTGFLHIKGTEYPTRGAMFYDELDTPLHQQAFRWFRDNHKHNGIVEGCKNHGFEWCIYPDIEHYIKPPNNFNTYEEAELACLKRLIEIVKTEEK